MRILIAIRAQTSAMRIPDNGNLLRLEHTNLRKFLSDSINSVRDGSSLYKLFLTRLFKVDCVHIFVRFTILAVFLICWVPFFTLHLTNAVCIIVHGEACIHFLAFFLTTWLGYMNSFMNPIIYTIYNPQYRRAFRRILLCDAKRS